MTDVTRLRSVEGEPDHYELEGELGFRTVVRLLMASRSLFNWGSAGLTVDLAAVSRADSAGMALLLEWMRQARVAGGVIHYRALPAQLQQIALASDLETLLPLDDHGIRR